MRLYRGFHNIEQPQRAKKGLLGLLYACLREKFMMVKTEKKL